MKALILAGGFATRLRPLSCTRPKILFPVLNKPLLEWTLKSLSKSGIKEAILAVNHQTAFHIKNSKYSKGKVKIAYSYDPSKKPLGTGGAIKHAEELLEDDNFLVVNGDIFTNINYTEIIKKHEKEKGAIATIALCTVKDPSRYGVAEIENSGRIRRFIEKPPPGMSPSNLINAGIYVLSHEIFKYIPKGGKVSLEREVFPKLVDEGKLFGYVFEGLWSDIGKAEDYLEVNKILLDSFRGKKVNVIKNYGKINEPVVCDESVTIEEGSTIGPYAVLGKNVSVGKNVHVENSIIFPGVSVSDGSLINGAIIGENVTIGRGVKIRGNCVIGDYAVIGDNVSLAEGVSICPAKEVFHDVSELKCII
ncbi:MAG: sugar phosphate nucleotidyltransferase [Candidatus Bathyarchaeia archaeon]